MLVLFGFKVTFVSLDGAQANRDFMKIFLPQGSKKSDSINTMKIKNVFDPASPNIYMIMDYSHVMKKIWKNISKSGLKPGQKSSCFLRGIIFYGNIGSRLISGILLQTH